MFTKSNKILSALAMFLSLVSITIYKIYDIYFFQGFLYGIILSFINILSIQFISNFFVKNNKSKIFTFFSVLLKILILIGIIICLIKFLSVDLIGFLTGFSVVLIVFILLIQGKTL